MDENLEQMMAELVAGIAPEDYERMGPALREFGLAIAEARQAEREAQRMRGACERALQAMEREREDLQRWQDARGRVLEDLDCAQERAINAFRLLEDAE